MTAHRTTRVLIVEDDPGIASAVTLVLQLKGYVVEVRDDGMAALARLQAQPLPDVVLVDLMLPGLGGRELVELMAADPQLGAIPVIVTTAWTGADLSPPPERHRLLLPKPFSLAELLAAVAGLTARSASGD